MVYSPGKLISGVYKIRNNFLGNGRFLLKNVFVRKCGNLGALYFWGIDFFRVRGYLLLNKNEFF